MVLEQEKRQSSQRLRLKLQTSFPSKNEVDPLVPHPTPTPLCHRHHHRHLRSRVLASKSLRGQPVLSTERLPTLTFPMSLLRAGGVTNQTKSLPSRRTQVIPSCPSQRVVLHARKKSPLLLQLRLRLWCLAKLSTPKSMKTSLLSSGLIRPLSPFFFKSLINLHQTIIPLFFFFFFLFLFHTGSF